MKELERRGYHVVAVDINAPRPSARDPWFKMDARTFFNISPTRFDLVVHCAALVGGRATIEGKPLQLAAEDLSLDAALFDWAIRTKQTRIVYFSSSAAYPVWLQKPPNLLSLREDEISFSGFTLGMPDETYGWVKLTGERLAREANRAGIPTHVFRPFSGYGPDQALDYPFPSFIKRTLMGMGRTADNPFEIWGHGEQVRDFVHIDDVVGAMFAAIEQNYFEPLNIGTGYGTSFQDLAALMGEIVYGKRPEYIKTHPDKPMGVEYRVADTQNLKKIYTPTKSLADGILEAVELNEVVPA